MPSIASSTSVAPRAGGKSPRGSSPCPASGVSSRGGVSASSSSGKSSRKGASSSGGNGSSAVSFSAASFSPGKSAGTPSAASHPSNGFVARGTGGGDFFGGGAQFREAFFRGVDFLAELLQLRRDFFSDGFGQVFESLVERAADFSEKVVQVVRDVDVARGEDVFLDFVLALGEGGESTDERFSERAQVFVNDLLIGEDFAHDLVVPTRRRRRFRARLFRFEDERERRADLPDDEHGGEQRQRSRAVRFPFPRRALPG